MGFSFNGTTSQSMGLATRITNEYRMPGIRAKDTDFLLHSSGKNRRAVSFKEGRYY